jgi:hypothetical protein
VVVAIFFAFGIAALVLTIWWTAGTLAQDDKAIKAGRLIDDSLLSRALASPSTFFALAMLLAGIACYKLNLLPCGLTFSPWRVFSGVIAALLVYPLGLAALLALLFGVGGLAEAVGFGQGPHSHLGEVLVFSYAATILCATGVLTVMLAALAFGLATRFWPRRIRVWGFAISAMAILSTVVASSIRQSIRFGPTTITDVTRNTDILFFSLAWNVELPIVIGQPLLAALLGHWLYQPAKEYALPPA